MLCMLLNRWYVCVTYNSLVFIHAYTCSSVCCCFKMYLLSVLWSAFTILLQWFSHTIFAIFMANIIGDFLLVMYNLYKPSVVWLYYQCLSDLLPRHVVYMYVLCMNVYILLWLQRVFPLCSTFNVSYLSLSYITGFKMPIISVSFCKYQIW